MALSYVDDLRSRSWVGFAEVAILAPELLTMSRRERSFLVLRFPCRKHNKPMA